MTADEALARIRAIVDACGSPGCVACPREIKATVGAIDGGVLYGPGSRREPPFDSKPLEDAVAAVLARLRERREEYVQSWVASTGFEPHECMIVEQLCDDGATRMWVEPRHAGQDIERAASLAAEVHRLRQENARLRKEVGADWERFCNAVGFAEGGRVADVLTVLGHWKNQERHADICNDLLSQRPLSDWHDDIGAVLWWRLPIDEPPYVGTPLDSDWPGYHTHWTPVPPADEECFR